MSVIRIVSMFNHCWGSHSIHFEYRMHDVVQSQIYMDNSMKIRYVLKMQWVCACLPVICVVNLNFLLLEMKTFHDRFVVLFFM